MIETSLKLTKSTIRLSLVRLCLSLDFRGRMIETSLTLDVVYIAQKCKLDLSWYDRSKSNFRKIPVLD